MPAEKEKVYTYKQHMARMKKVEEATKQKEEAKRIGRCPECNGSQFTLRVENHILYRTCKNSECGDVKEF